LTSIYTVPLVGHAIETVVEYTTLVADCLHNLPHEACSDFDKLIDHDQACSADGNESSPTYGADRGGVDQQ